MDNPKVRWVETLPVEQDGREMFVLRDPDGLTEGSLVVSREVLFLISLMNGNRSIRDLQEEFMRASGRLISTEQIESVVNTMDRNFLLQNERFESYFQKLREEYDASSCRPSFLAGRSYPGNAQELASFLDSMFPSRERPPLGRGLKGILAPHIDYARGRGVYRETYKYLPGSDADLLVLFGTCHHLAPKIWNISLKDFATPLGTAVNAKGLGKLLNENHFLKDYIAEWPHKTEHSIELQLPLIQFLLSQRQFEILPIVTGSMHEYVDGSKSTSDGELQELIGAFREVLERYGKSYCIIAGADLAHIGAQFGDRYGLDKNTLEESKAKDRTLLESVKGVDRDQFFACVKNEGDERRICGLAPIYFQLSLLDGVRGEIISYDQWTDGASSVSFAGALFREG